MKTSTLCIPLVLAMIFVGYLLTYAFLDPGMKGFYVEIGGVAPPAECGDAEYVLVELLSPRRVRLNGEVVDQEQLLQRLQKAFQHRPERVVYLLADSGVTMQDVVTAIDIANEAAKDVHVRLVTPGNQNEMCLGHDPLASLTHADK